MLLSLFLVGYGFLTWVYDPLSAEKEKLFTEKVKLEDTIFQKNIPNLEKKMGELEKESNEVLLQLAEIKKTRDFGPIDYQELITYLGKEADSLGVDVVQFRKHDFINQNVYWEIPYEITIQGDYDNIILFVNSLYKLDKYFYVTGMDLREVSLIPMSDKVVSGDETLKEEIKFEWANGFIEKLDKTIPSDIKSTDKDEVDSQDSFMSDFATEMEEIQTEEMFSVKDKLQLNFTFHFVSLDDPSEMVTIENIEE